MLLMLLVPGVALASEHGMSMDHGKMEMDHAKKEMDHEKMEMDHKAMDHGEMDHSKMEMEHSKKAMSGMSHDMGDMMMLDTEEVKGVKAMFHLNDVKSAMAKVGQPYTHHFMVNFVDSKTGKAIEKGRVEVKVTTPAGVEEKKQVMMGMDGHFGVDLVLDQQGLYHFKVGTKLADGKKRLFHPHHEF